MNTINVLDLQISRIVRCAFKAQDLGISDMQERTGIAAMDFHPLETGKGFSLAVLDVAAKSLGLGRASDVVKQAEEELDKEKQEA